ncbi:MAG: NUDIX domain-containing protein [Janthinobacterium lividum]
MATYKFCPVCASGLVERPDNEGRVRVGCADDTCGFMHWDNPLPVVAAIVEYEGRILLARNAAWPNGRFALIAGFMERGEAPESAVAREIKEETSLDAEAVTLVGVYDFSRRNEVLMIYHVRASGEIKLSPELAEYQLVEPAELRPWKAGTGPGLADWMRSQSLPVTFADW